MILIKKLKKGYNAEVTEICFNPEKYDIFSFGITFLECILLLD